MDQNLTTILSKSNVTASILPGIVGPDTLIGNLTYGDLERIIKFVSQNNPVRWYDGKRYWKNTTFSLFNNYPAFNVTEEVGGSKTQTLFPRLGKAPKVYLLETDTPKQISECINYANANNLGDRNRVVTIQGVNCRFTEPPANLQHLTSFLMKASKDVTSVVPPQHVITTMAMRPKVGGFKTKFKRTKRGRYRTAYARNNEV